MDTQKFPPCPYCGSTEMRTGFQTYEATVKKQRGSMMGGSALQHLFCGRCGMVAASRVRRPETFDSAVGRWYGNRAGRRDGFPCRSILFYEGGCFGRTGYSSILDPESRRACGK